MSIPLGPDFFDRCGRQHKYASESDGPYTPELLLGDYADRPLCTGIGSKGLLMPFIARTLSRALRTAVEPVYGLDSGGGMSMSWLRLAEQFRGEIKDGRLVLGATSLNTGPEKFLQLAREAAKAGAEDAPSAQTLEEAERLLGEFGDSVQYMAVDPQVKDGPKLVDWPAGSCVAIHERRGGTVWSRIPEMHLLRLGSLLSGTGRMLLAKEDPGETFGVMKPWERSVRQRAVGYAIATLTMPPQYDLTYAIRPQEGQAAGMELEYYVFSGSQAPPLAVG